MCAIKTLSADEGTSVASQRRTRERVAKREKKEQNCSRGSCAFGRGYTKKKGAGRCRGVTHVGDES